MANEYPYPNPFEILRYILLSVDLKRSNKLIDELSAKKIYDPRDLDDLLHHSFLKQIQKWIGSELACLALKHISAFYKEYLIEVVGKVSADGSSREKTLELLTQSIFKYHMSEFIKELNAKALGPSPMTWFSDTVSTIGVLFEWLEDNVPNWCKHLSSFKKERKDMINNWKKGKDLPSFQSIGLLDIQDHPAQFDQIEVDWKKIKFLILVARVIDYTKKSRLGKQLVDDIRIDLWGGYQRLHFAETLAAHQQSIQINERTNLHLIAKLQQELRLTVKKSDPEIYRNHIDQVKEQIRSSKELESTEYWVLWHDARWHVFNGLIDKANQLYKSALEGALFRSGDNQRAIIEEALVIAASVNKPDRVFLKKLKWMQINLGYDIPSITDKEPSQKVEDTIEDWEVDIWRSNLQRKFPRTGLFPGVIYDMDGTIQGPLIDTGLNKLKPDLRYPNRKIKVGDTWKRSMPQLVWFARNGEVDICTRLIEKGANVNVSSDVGDTPIMMALSAMSVTDHSFKPPNTQLYDLFCHQNISSENINLRTQKKRLIAIILAVETGRQDVVSQVLKMGADPNKRGQSDEQTALNLCLKYIGIIKNPQLFKRNQMEIPLTPEVIDSARRETAGFFGHTQNDYKKIMEHQRKNPRFLCWQSYFNDQWIEAICNHMKLPEMRAIAKLLIDAGSDVNAEHKSPLKGYTPLMLAAELDERELFDAMLVAGGDVFKFCNDPRDGSQRTLRHIAQEFGSEKVMQTLDYISIHINKI